MEYEAVSGPRWGLRSSRVTKGQQVGDGEEGQALLLQDVDESYSKKSARKKPWKAKDEDYLDSWDAGAIPLAARTRPQEPDQCVETDVQPDDTLQSVSLKYNVPVAELKRVNNLLSEAEFFALKRIKIPVKPMSLLTETLPTVARPENGWYVKSAASPASSSTLASSTPVSETDNSNADPTEEALLVNLGGDLDAPHPSASKHAKKANRFLKSMDRDLERIREKQEQLSGSPERERKESSHLSMSTLTSSGDYTMTHLAIPNGSDSGSWCSREALCCYALIVISVLTILFVAYVGYHSQVFVSHSERTVHHEKAVEGGERRR